MKAFIALWEGAGWPEQAVVVLLVFVVGYALYDTLAHLGED